MTFQSKGNQIRRCSTLNKERTSYKNGRADTEFNLSSEFGDITVDTPDDDNQ